MTQKTHTIVGIAGASGSGKSSLARNICQEFQRRQPTLNVAILGEDHYYRRRDDIEFAERERINYDHPDAFEYDLLRQHLDELRKGQTIPVPQYDYHTHNRFADSISMSPPDVLILEGILVFHNAAIREQLDLAVFVDVPLEICLERRLERDVKQRGRTPESVNQQFEETVRPMFHQFIDPCQQKADVIVPGGGDNRTAIKMIGCYLEELIR